MSVSFYLRSGETAFPSCPSCGGNMAFNPAPDRECADASCLGYGPEMIKSTPELNVANANARVIIRDLLGYTEAEVYEGELDAEDVKLRLSMAGYRAAGAVRPAAQQGNVYSCGLDLERIQSYIETLGTLAELASRRGEPIVYN